MDVSHSETPRLRWILADGKLCNVSEFCNIPPKHRPEVYCPVCERQVTLKLGKKRVHHFAHRPEDICPSTKPETALHLNCKFHIYQQLQASRVLYTSTPCKRCGRSKPELWKENWDAVEVEYRIDSLRPDIALLQNGKVVGAIEIFVTHEVSAEKALRLQRQDVDWIEVYGHEGIYEEPDAWTTYEPLSTGQQYPKSAPWICPRCEKIQKREEYERNHRVEIFCARLVDLYFRSGKKYRHVFYVKHAFTNGEKSRIWIEDEKRRNIVEVRAPITEQSHIRLNEAFKRKHLALMQKADIMDDEMGWVRWLTGRKFVSRDFDNFPFRYDWDDDEKKWILQAHLKWKKLD
jgi:hypothetical protein